jgi:hypothetical protein
MNLGGLMNKFLRWFYGDAIKVGNCCGDCKHYELCYYNHVEKDMQNTLEHPACDKFKGGV